MAEIKKIVEKKKNLTSLIVTGKVSSNDIIETIKDFYKSEFTLKVLWDFTNCDLTSATADQVQTILSNVKRFVGLRRGGRTAIVMSNEFGFGMGRMYETLSEVDGLAVPQRVFKTKDEAMKWLDL